MVMVLAEGMMTVDRLIIRDPEDARDRDLRKLSSHRRAAHF